MEIVKVDVKIKIVNIIQKVKMKKLFESIIAVILYVLAAITGYFKHD